MTSRETSVGGGCAIGVVVVSHESVADLPACLGALASADGVARVVVVDNASSDGSREAVLACRDPRVELLALAENTGFAGGCNRGWRHLGTSVEYLVVANPDVVVEPGCLALAAARLAADRDLGAVAPRLMRPDGVTVDSVGQVLHRFTLEVQDRGFGRGLDGDLLASAPALAPCGALGVFRRSALDAVADRHGPWAEAYFCFWEDLELGWRLRRAGFGVVTAPEAVATHRRGAGAAAGRGPLRWRRPAALEACVVSNRWATLARHLAMLDLLPRLPLLLAWDASVVTLGIVRRPALAGHLCRRLPLVATAWRDRSGVHPRLAALA